ncbi:coilin [Xenentodon cancila]
MAAAGNGFIRLRLYFDYPPPVAVGCRMCWLLVDMNACRVVADLESTIREKFGFSRGSIFSLFIQDCYLPHTESIYVVRDNDDIRVKVECLAQVNGDSSHPEKTRDKSRKRQKPTEEDSPGCEDMDIKCQKKKKKKVCEENTSEDIALAAGDSKRKTSAEERPAQKKKKTKVAGSHAATPKTPQKTPVRVDLPVKGKKKPAAAPVKRQNLPSSDSSSSEADKVSTKTTFKSSSCAPAASKTPPSTKPTQKPPHPPSSSSSDTESSSDEAHSVKIPPSHFHRPSGSVSDEIQLVIRKPHPPSWSLAGRRPQRGHCGRGGPGPGQQGRSETSRTIPGPDGLDSSYNCTKEASYHTDSLSNKSVVLQNGAGTCQKQDYSSMPLLAAPPQVGQKIAFKLLELTENYTPEISEYKEGKIVNFDPTTKQIELELLLSSQAPVEPGKFDLVYQNPDGSERVEYAVTRGSWVTERWESLLEPRLVI